MPAHSSPLSTWPRSLWLVRHGESAGNVARDQAMACGAREIDIAMRDVDVPLSDRGRAQAAALARWTQRRDEDDRPTIVLTSPYIRAVETAAPIAATIETPHSQTPIIDERLREKEFGALDRLTRAASWRGSPPRSRCASGSASSTTARRAGELVRCGPAPARRHAGAPAQLRERARRDRRPSSDRAVFSLPDRTARRAEDPRDRCLGMSRMDRSRRIGSTRARITAVAVCPEAYNSTEALEHEGVPVTAEPTAQPDPKAR